MFLVCCEAFTQCLYVVTRVVTFFFILEGEKNHLIKTFFYKLKSDKNKKQTKNS